ncbi:MAG: nitroreductase/quinone reductase family protein [Gammaproteobacteria bacterium]
MNNGSQHFPPEVIQAFVDHEEQYLSDPEAAHMWDPIVIGVPGGPVPCLLLFHTGRKSGKQLKSVLQYYQRNDQIAIVASKGGAPSHPAWYLNLIAEPQCEVWIGTHKTPARARLVTASERAFWWPEIKAEQPAQVGYEKSTEREIPILILELETSLPG